MPATVHVIASFRAAPGREEELKTALTALIAPSRREIGCFQYDLLRNAAEPRDFCFVERWESEQALDRHSATPHVTATLSQTKGLLETPPDVRRYHLV